MSRLAVVGVMPMGRLAVVGALSAVALALAAAPAPASRPLGKIIVNSGESIQCPQGSAACVASVQATTRNRHNRRVTLGEATITIAPAATAKLIFALNRAGKRLLLAHGPLHARLTVAIREGSDAAILSTHQITIGVPKHHGRRR